MTSARPISINVSDSETHSYQKAATQVHARPRQPGGQESESLIDDESHSYGSSVLDGQD